MQSVRAGSVVGIVTGYGLDGRDRIPVGARFSEPAQSGPPSLLYNAYRVFPGGKERPRRDADPSPPSSAVVKKSRAIPLLPLWAVWPVQSLSAFTYFTR